MRVMTIEEATKYLKENPQEFINKLMQFPDSVLERKLDVVREQKKMAFDQQKKDSFELLSIKEDLIIKVRLIKSENDPEERSIVKLRQQKNKNNGVEDIQNKVNEDYTNQSNEPEQFFFDF